MMFVERFKITIPCVALLLVAPLFPMFSVLEDLSYGDQIWGPFSLFKTNGVLGFSFLLLFSTGLFMVSHPVAPRWWTGVLTVIGSCMWWFFGWFPYLSFE